MATATDNLTQYSDKKVVVVRKQEDGSAKEVEGTVQTANELGLLIKPKGQTKFDLIPADEIEDIRLAQSTAKAIARKTLKVVELGQARSHLVERHAFTLSQVNAMSEEEAFQTHEGIDHEAGDLGHVHGSKDAAKADDTSSDES